MKTEIEKLIEEMEEEKERHKDQMDFFHAKSTVLLKKYYKKKNVTITEISKEMNTTWSSLWNSFSGRSISVKRVKNIYNSINQASEKKMLQSLPNKDK